MTKLVELSKCGLENKATEKKQSTEMHFIVYYIIT